MRVSLFVNIPKMGKCDGKMEFFCWPALTLPFPHSTERHGNEASTKSVPCSQGWLCLMQHFTSPWGYTNTPIFHSPSPRRRKVCAHFTGWEWINTQKASCKTPVAEMGPKHRGFWRSLHSCFAPRMWTRTGRIRYYCKSKEMLPLKYELVKWHSLNGARPSLAHYGLSLVWAEFPFPWLFIKFSCEDPRIGEGKSDLHHI